MPSSHPIRLRQHFWRFWAHRRWRCLLDANHLFLRKSTMQTKNVGESFCWQQLSFLHKFPVWVAGQEIPLLWNWNSKLSENTDFFSLPDAEIQKSETVFPSNHAASCDHPRAKTQTGGTGPLPNMSPPHQSSTLKGKGSMENELKGWSKTSFLG